MGSLDDVPAHSFARRLLGRRGGTRDDTAARPRLDAGDVEHCYDLLLGRTPSLEEVEAQLAGCESVTELLEVIVASDEYTQVRGEELVPRARVYANVWTPRLGAYTRPVGQASPDGIARIGREGVIFLDSGTNDVRTQFTGDFELPDGWADAWRTLVREREEAVAAMGARAAWLVVPDKLAVDLEHLTERLAVGRRPVQLLREDLGLPLAYPVEKLRAVAGRAYLRTDTHLTVAGNRVLAAEVLGALGAPTPPALEELGLADHLAIGDLGARFNPPIAEVMHTATSWPARIIEDNRAEIAAVGGHLGTRRIMEHADAPDPRTCVIFGDSFGFGDPAYQGLAWWLSIAFRHTHFIWLPFGWDPDYAATARADVVVFQGAERFCVRVPPRAVAVDELAAETLRRRTGMELSELPTG